MSKYTRNKGIKEELKKPDEFISFWEHAYNKARAYGRPLTYALAGGVGLVAAVWIGDYVVTSGRHDATAAVGRVIAVNEGDLITDQSPAKPDDRVPRFKSEKERAEGALAELDKLEKSHGGKAAVKRAQMVRAGLLFDLGRWTEAEAAFKRYLDDAAVDDPLRFLAREGLALCAESQGKLDEALKLYQDLEPKAGDFYRDRVLYAQGRLLARKGDKKGAGEKFRDLLAKSPQSALREDAQSRLGLLGFSVEKADEPGAAPGGPGG